MAKAQLHGNPLTFLSVAFSQKLSAARLVLWRKGQPRGPRYGSGERELRARIAYLMYWRNREDYVPAIYCPDMETAFYVYAMFSFTGRGLGICLQCGEVFQKIKPDSVYCCFSHAEAYRIRRWREMQRQKKKARKA